MTAPRQFATCCEVYNILRPVLGLPDPRSVVDAVITLTPGEWPRVELTQIMLAPDGAEAARVRGVFKIVPAESAGGPQERPKGE